MNSSTPPGVRKRMLALIHIAKKQLNLDDDAYRSLLESATGKTSSAGMSLSELNAVIQTFESMGFRVSGTDKSGKKLSPKTRDKPASAKTQADKIRALWIECANAGVINNRYDDALQRFVKTVCKVERVEWLTHPQAVRIIKILEDKLEAANGGEGSERTDSQDSGSAENAGNGV